MLFALALIWHIYFENIIYLIREEAIFQLGYERNAIS